MQDSTRTSTVATTTSTLKQRFNQLKQASKAKPLNLLQLKSLTQHHSNLRVDGEDAGNSVPPPPPPKTRSYSSAGDAPLAKREGIKVPPRGTPERRSTFDGVINQPHLSKLGGSRGLESTVQRSASDVQGARHYNSISTPLRSILRTGSQRYHSKELEVPSKQSTSAALEAWKSASERQRAENRGTNGGAPPVSPRSILKDNGQHVQSSPYQSPRILESNAETNPFVHTPSGVIRNTSFNNGSHSEPEGKFNPKRAAQSLVPTNVDSLTVQTPVTSQQSQQSPALPSPRIPLSLPSRNNRTFSDSDAFGRKNLKEQDPQGDTHRSSKPRTHSDPGFHPSEGREQAWETNNDMMISAEELRRKSKEVVAGGQYSGSLQRSNTMERQDTKPATSERINIGGGGGTWPRKASTNEIQKHKPNDNAKEDRVTVSSPYVFRPVSDDEVKSEPETVVLKSTTSTPMKDGGTWPRMKAALSEPSKDGVRIRKPVARRLNLDLYDTKKNTDIYVTMKSASEVTDSQTSLSSQDRNTGGHYQTPSSATTPRVINRAPESIVELVKDMKARDRTPVTPKGFEESDHYIHYSNLALQSEQNTPEKHEDNNVSSGSTTDICEKPDATKNKMMVMNGLSEVLEDSLDYSVGPPRSDTPVTSTPIKMEAHSEPPPLIARRVPIATTRDDTAILERPKNGYVRKQRPNSAQFDFDTRSDSGATPSKQGYREQLRKTAAAHATMFDIHRSGDKSKKSEAKPIAQYHLGYITPKVVTTGNVTFMEL